MIKWLKKLFEPEYVVSTKMAPNGHHMDITTNKRTYRGNGTVWHVYPSGIRCGTFKEGQICNWWEKAEWELEDKEATK